MARALREVAARTDVAAALERLPDDRDAPGEASRSRSWRPAVAYLS
ncbi:hypothetical protein [Streptomyces anulatus]